MDETGGILPQVEKVRTGSLVEKAIRIGGPVAERAAKLWDGAVDFMRGVDIKIRGGVIAGLATLARSEERRVGKECRSRWSPYH